MPSDLARQLEAYFQPLADHCGVTVRIREEGDIAFVEAWHEGVMVCACCETRLDPADAAQTTMISPDPGRDITVLLCCRNCTSWFVAPVGTLASSEKN